MEQPMASDNGALHGADGAALVRRVVERLSRTIDEENAAIRSGPGVDVSRFVEAKNRTLYELERALRAADAPMADPRTSEAVRELYLRLEVNRTLLGAQVKAVGEAIDLIEGLAGSSRTDGTYGNPAHRKLADRP